MIQISLPRLFIFSSQSLGMVWGNGEGGLAPMDTRDNDEEIAMERNRNWQGWVAIALAGLALIVALGGRGPWGGQRMAMWAERDAAQAVPAAPAAPAAPQVAPQAPEAPFGRGFGRGQDGPRFMHGQGEFREFRGGPPMMMGRHGPGIFGILGLIFGLAKLVALGLLAWLLLRMFNQRRSAPPAAPTTPAGHDPRVE